MVLNILRLPLAGMALFLVWAALGDGVSSAYGQAAGTPPGPYYNYYASPAGGTSAAMYPAPQWAPAMAGYTYIPYQPLAPQEMLYHHHNSFMTCYPGGGHAYTHVSYGGHQFGVELRRFFVGHNSHCFWDGMIGHDNLSDRILRKGPN